MDHVDLERIRDLRSAVRWAADPRAFDLLRGMREARWAVAEAADGTLAGMVGAVPLGGIGVLCHLAVRGGYRKMGLGRTLSSWAVSYLRSRGARTVRLYSTVDARELYLSMGFEPIAPRKVYRLEGTPAVGARGSSDGHRVGRLLLGDLPELYGADHWSYGDDRSALILAILRQLPGGGLVARDSSGAIKGYLLRSDPARPGSASRIGPFAASDPGVGRLLLARALREGAAEETPVDVIVPGTADSPAHGLLQEFGFVGSEDRLRMELGVAGEPADKGLEQYATTPYLAT